MSLMNDSICYQDRIDVYERFCRAEDFPRHVESYLRPLIVSLDVLDLGCGTGKYAALLGRESRRTVGVDQSPQAIHISKKNYQAPNTTFCCAPAQQTGLEKTSFDLIIATWMLGTIADLQERERVLVEMKRLIRPSGRILLVENDVSGEFEMIRGNQPPDSPTTRYHKWLLEHGFTIATRIQSQFDFATLKDAQDIIGSIWGEAARTRVKARWIKHHIAVFETRPENIMVG